MNPMFSAAIGSIFRWALALGAGYLVQRGIWSEQESTIYVTAAALGLTSLVWSLYQKYIERAKLVTALASPHPISEATVEKLVSEEPRRPPVTIDKERTPYPVGLVQRQESVSPVVPPIPPAPVPGKK